MSRSVFGIDFGTSTIKIYNGLTKTVITEKDIIAIKNKTQLFEFGDEALKMYEKTPPNINIIFPIKYGVIADLKNMKLLFESFYKKITKASGSKMGRFCIAVPTDITEVEKRAVEEAAFAAGAREVHLIEEPVAAAIGAGVDIGKPCGNMIVDIGGGTADIAVISLGGAVVHTSIKIAGDDFDEAIVRYMRKKHNLLIGERTAEDIKIKVGTTYPLIEEESMEVRGRNLVTGLPKTVTVTSSETEEALRETSGKIVEAVVSVLEQTPPELSADILDRGIVLTGGGAMLRGLEELIEEKTGINTMTAEDPMKVVAIGTGQFVEFMSGRKDF